METDKRSHQLTVRTLSKVSGITLATMSLVAILCCGIQNNRPPIYSYSMSLGIETMLSVNPVDLMTSTSLKKQTDYNTINRILSLCDPVPEGFQFDFGRTRCVVANDTHGILMMIDADGNVVYGTKTLRIAEADHEKVQQLLGTNFP